MVLGRLGIRPEILTIKDSEKGYFTESLSYSLNGALIAEAGKISRKYIQKFGVDQEVFYGHIEWETILKVIKKHKIEYRELPKYPAVKRDLALLVDKGIKFSQIRDMAFKAEKSLLKEVSLFDVYESESLGENKKSYAISFILQDEFKTLTENNIEKVINNFIRIFEKEFEAHIR